MEKTSEDDGSTAVNLGPIPKKWVKQASQFPFELEITWIADGFSILDIISVWLRQALRVVPRSIHYIVIEFREEKCNG